MTSGLSGSPALMISRRACGLPADRSALMSIRHTVGGAQNVDTLSPSSWSFRAVASNLG
jgi:hypothetical protein